MSQSSQAPVLAIDGPSGTGKGSVGYRIAKTRGWHLLDSGALYRAFAFAANEQGIAPDDIEGINALDCETEFAFETTASGEVEIRVDGREVSMKVRGERGGQLASMYAAVPAVRSRLIEYQRSRRQDPGLVADGRDMGTVVFPDATSAPEVVSALCQVEIIPVTAEGVVPTHGHYLGGVELTVTGTGFIAAADTEVTIDGVALVDQIIVDDTIITGLLPPALNGIGQFDVRVSNSLGEAILTEAFTYGFIRGVVNGDIRLDIGDAMYLCYWLYSGGEAPECLEAAEVNDDQLIDLADPIYIVMYLFRNGPLPSAPFPEAGLDPDAANGFGCDPCPACDP